MPFNFSQQSGGQPPPKPEPQKTPQGGGFQFAQGGGGNAPQAPGQTPQTPQVTPTPKLPEGAKGLDPAGNPFFGEGIPGILKKWKYNFTKDVKEVDEADWADVKDRWKQMQGSTVEEMGGSERLSLLGETISKGYQDITANAEGSPLAWLVKGVPTTIAAVGDLFSIPAQKLEQVGGAIEGFQEAANEADSILPKLDQNALTQTIEETPLGWAYDFARIALSDSDDKWDATGKAIQDGWQSGRIFYSQVFDRTLKEKFLQEYREGGDPALIAMKLQNPLAELGGQLLLDPLNLVGAFGKASKVAKELDGALDSVRGSGLLKTAEGAEALKAMSNAVDEGSAFKALDALTTAQRAAVDNVQSTSKLLNVKYGINDLTTSSRQNAIIGKGKEALGNMALILKQGGMSYDGVAEAMLYGIKSVSKNTDEMKAGLAGLSHLPNANMWLSDDYIETFTMMNKMMSSTDGAVDGSRLSNLMKAKNPAEFAEQATKLMQAATFSEIPDVGELANAAKLVKQAAKEGGEITEKTKQMAKVYDNLPHHVKYLDKINSALSKYIKNPINSVLSPLYFNLQGGVAVKNIVSNNELILIDQGAKAWLKDGKYWSQESKVNYIKDIFGELPTSASGFKSLVSQQTDKPAFLFGKLMEKGEETGAVTVVAASVRDTFSKMIPKIMPNLAKEVAGGIMTQKQSDKLLSLALKNNGNMEKTISDFREFYKLGAVEAWRNLGDYVKPFEKDALQGLDYWDEIEQLAHNGAATTDEVEEVFARINKSIDSRAEMATGDVIGLSGDHAGAPAWGDLMKAVEEGHLDPGQQQVFTAVMEGAEQARLEYQTLLDDVTLKAQDALSREGKLAEAQHIGQEMNRVRDTLRKAGPATAKEAHDITQDAWRWSDAIKADKKPTPESLKAFWTKAGLEGAPPLDLSKGTLLKTLWEQRFKNVSQTWNSSFDAIVAESETILKQMDGIIDTTELQSMASRTRHVTAQAQAIRSATFEKGALRIKQGVDKIDEAGNVLEKAASIAIPPPHPLGSQPSLPRAWNESSKGAKYVLDNIKNEILARWGKTDDARKLSPEIDEILSRVVSEATPKMAEVKAAALKIAAEHRNYTLLNYGAKTYGDVALSYVMPYHFYYTRSTKNWMSRIATNPEILAGYAKYKDKLEQINKDLPDWYKQQLNINPLADNQNFSGKEFLGIPLDHPLFINLEATINPLYGLTGTDFQDPAKRTNWATATMDDLGKFGPTVWAPIQMGIAAKLYADGETDAASRWGNRLIPETAQIKAVSSMFGKPIELDPAVNFFSGGIDPYERGRMGYAAAELIQSGQFTAENIQAQFQQQSGEAWDLSYQMAVRSRSASSISSYFLGVGFKPRSTNDVMVEDMLTNLNKLYNSSDMMSSENYKNAWEQLRSQYPDGLVDTVLLAKKGGPKRDAAYAFSVLGRLPPGEMSDVFKAIGISQQDISKFYDSKGFADPKAKFTQTEKDRFMAAVIDMGTMLKIPDDATRGEWNEARTAYQGVYANIKKQLGDDIWDKVNHYYDLKDDNKDAAAAFKQEHPEVQAAFQMKGEAVANTPILGAYYGGIDNIEAYVSGKVRQQLSEKYGAEVYQVQTDYFNADNPRAYLAAHPELKRFWADKKKLDVEGEKMFYQMAKTLPESAPAQFQEGFAPQSGVQQQMYDALQPQGQIPPWEKVSQGMPPWMQNEIAAYAQDGKELSKRGKKELDYLAGQGGFYDAKDMLRTAVLSMQQSMQGGQAQAQQGFQFQP